MVFMAWIQKTISLAPKRRGFHVVTSEVLNQCPEIRFFEIGLAHLFLLHTSAALSINENADPDVCGDLERHFNVLAPENAPYYRHTIEGPDDMPAHIKAALLGTDLTIPVQSGTLFLGTWQGIYLCEHRNHGGARRICITLSGQRMSSSSE